MSVKILVIEDEPTLADLLIEFLSAEGYKVKHAISGLEGLELFEKWQPQLGIFDIMLPDKDGLEVLGKIRKTNTITPILLLTAKAQKEDVIKGLQLGADDYVTKPFNFKELLLRIQNLIKRLPSTTKDKTIGTYTFDFVQQLLINPNKTVRLTAMECNILQLLYEHRNTLLERKLVLKTIWGNDDYFNFRSIDVFISKLRKYLADDPSIKILSIRGKGYKLIC